MITQEAIHSLLDTHGCDGILITKPGNLTWATGFVSSNALLYLSRGGVTLVTDGRYATAAHAVKGVTVLLANQESLVDALKSHIAVGTKLGYQGDHMNTAELEASQQSLPGVEFIGITSLLDQLIAVKRPDELEKIERAQRITEAVFTEALELLKPGITETDLAAEIIYRQLKHGADGISPDFWPIVSFGTNAAMPHAHPTDTKLKNDQVVLLDFGCTVDGYCSDMTRTVFFGTPDDEFRKVYATVLEAQEASIAVTRAGTAGKDIDRAGRDIIAAAGYGKAFGHGTGHAVGLDIHEWPILNPRSSDIMPAKAVITIEPGIYLPGKFGVRIEDMMVIEKDGCRNLTKASKDLIII